MRSLLRLAFLALLTLGCESWPLAVMLQPDGQPATVGGAASAGPSETGGTAGGGDGGAAALAAGSASGG
jgi:hypothetical protein